MSLYNVSDEIVRSQFTIYDVQSILTLASEPDIQKIMVGPDDPVDPILQKKMNLVKDLLANSATTEVPFTPYLTNAQKKKVVKAAYLTRSKGPLPSLPK